MKLKGKKIEGPNVEVVVIPRGEKEPIVFKCGAVLDDAPFNKLCPEPQPPKMQRPGGSWSENVEDPEYRKSIEERWQLHSDWMILQSLTATEGLEWEMVDLGKPETWKGWRDELKAAGFSMMEINHVQMGVLRANCLDERVIKEARESFFRSQAKAPSA